MHLRPGLLAVPALLAACAATPGGDGRPVSYACDDGTRLQVAFQDETALVRVNGAEPLRLPRQRSASGIWYATPQQELRGKGREAQWTVERRAPTLCRVAR